MLTFCALLALCEGNSPVTGEFPSQRPVTRRFMFFICTWTNDWANNLDAGAFRRHRVDYGVAVMYFVELITNALIYFTTFTYTESKRPSWSSAFYTQGLRTGSFVIIWDVRPSASPMQTTRPFVAVAYTLMRLHRYLVIIEWLYTLGRIGCLSDLRVVPWSVPRGCQSVTGTLRWRFSCFHVPSIICRTDHTCPDFHEILLYLHGYIWWTYVLKLFRFYINATSTIHLYVYLLCLLNGIILHYCELYIPTLYFIGTLINNHHTKYTLWLWT